MIRLTIETLIFGGKHRNTHNAREGDQTTIMTKINTKMLHIIVIKTMMTFGVNQQSKKDLKLFSDLSSLQLIEDKDKPLLLLMVMTTRRPHFIDSELTTFMRPHRNNPIDGPRNLYFYHHPKDEIPIYSTLTLVQ